MDTSNILEGELSDQEKKELEQQQAEADHAVDRVREAATSNLSSQMNKIYDSLVNETRDAPARLPEELFVKDFLPYFVGEKSFQEQSDILSIWIGIAGSPTSEVSIIDSKNEELFRVPPLWSTNFIDPDKGKSNLPDMKTVLAEYDRQRAHLPIVGDKFLADAFDERASEIVKNVPETVDMAHSPWASIFERYNKIPAGQEVTNTTVKETDSGKLSDDELVYD